ncbi:ABC transporter permease [Parablautia muri]|uniref:Uncharacterized protein n=1 Tax=Parablautia muri TaxID=2320879 RepID=A0A9X5BE58_9FIRM|nr:ABC transporter permease [Parablautia muri]NBJ92151.1 hypothetical protein [Parablautia muri]
MRKWLLNLLWICILGGSRVLYFWNAGKTVADTYGYFEQAVERAWENGTVSWAGLGDAYIWTLSWLFRLMGDRIELVGVYQLTLQILWLILLFAGASMLLGRRAGFLLSGVLMILPWSMPTIFVVSPENYYMLHFSLFLVILGAFCSKKKNHRVTEMTAAGSENKKMERLPETGSDKAATENKEAGKNKETTQEGQEQLQQAVEKEEGYVITEDGRRVKLFDNPLPLPPKHVKKNMGFDFKVSKDDFDYQVEDRDDFDV